MNWRTDLRIALAAGLALFGLPAAAQDLSYTPINPSFGGNPFNSSHLLGVAGAQNDYKEPTTATSQADLFSRQLQSRLLSALASQVTDAIFGDDPQDSGTITFGDQTITFVRSLDSVKLSISDAATGTVTDIEIPTFVDVTG
ncbi:MAG: curli assembly protein CsgF [Phenylobacterium sp.]|uniref:curli assembly protein CsgF n=1 Tax=Phenylobacterium sp. TaxID=1871053 RepID=UPI00391DFF06